MRSLVLVAMLAPGAAAQCELARLAPGDGQPGDGFGRSLAIEGGRALVGAPSSGGGGAYVFELSPLFGWGEREKLVPSDAVVGQAFGAATALSGGRLAVGAPGDASAGPLTGAVYVFEETPGGWAERQKLVATDGAQKDLFGGSNDAGQGVALEGTTLLVGAGYADGPAPNAGAAYVFEELGGSWTQTAKLLAAAPQPAAALGVAVALDGDVALVGAPRLDDSVPVAGAAHVFERSGTGWSETAVLAAADLAPGNRFGASVALDGAWAAVGAPRAGAAGAVHLFQDGPAGWVEVARLEPGAGDPAEAFGTSVALSGTRLVVGAAPPDTKTDPAPASAAWVYEHDGTAWTETAELALPPAPGYAGVAGAVALSGATPLVGARQLEGLNALPGAASVFALADDGCPGPVSLTAGPVALSLAGGGAQGLIVQAGSYHAGDTYLVIGSATGTAPGFPLDMASVPLVPDAYTTATVADANQGVLVSTLGVLDAQGSAAAGFAFGPGQDPALLGTTLHHACLVFRAGGGATAAIAASNAVPVELGQPLSLLAEDFESGAPGWTFSNPLFGLWHVAPDGECGATTSMAAYHRGPAGCDYDAGPGGLNGGTLISPAFTVAGQPPLSVSFRSACELDANGDDLVSVVLEHVDGPETATLAVVADLESEGRTEWRNLLVPSPSDWIGRDARLRFVFAAQGTAGGPSNDALGWMVDDVSVSADAP